MPGGQWPNWRQWVCFPKVLPSREKWLFFGLVFGIGISLIGLLSNLYLRQTIVQPRTGGSYTEGLLGQPRYINPILAQTNDADRDIAQIVYSSLFKYDGYGNLIPDLAKRYTIEDDGLTYNISLKKDVFWHDNQPLNADDVIFTIKTIQDPEYKSPLKTNWQGVKIEKVDDYTIKFTLNNIYAPFLHNLTVGILPKHLWAGISAANFLLAEYNLKPVGSGPYKFKNLKNDKDGKINSIELARNEQFYLPYSQNAEIQGPFIDKITFKFYSSQDELVDGLKKREVDGLSFAPAEKIFGSKNSLIVNKINLPIYYAVFFNQTESKALADKNVRQALAYALNKQQIVDDVLKGEGIIIDSPLLPGWFGYSEDITKYGFDAEKARQILTDNKWTESDEDGVLEKTIGNESVKLEINLLTINWPELTKAAEIIKARWEDIGAKVNLTTVDSNAVQQDYIRPRQYQAFLFGEILNADPDPFAFWHSSQKKDPGLNLSLYQNKDVDKLLEDARQTTDNGVRAAKYAEFQKIITNELPAIFLYSPTYLYPVDKSVKGIDLERLSIHSQRFCQIEDWFIKTKRIWK